MQISYKKLYLNTIYAWTFSKINRNFLSMYTDFYKDWLHFRKKNIGTVSQKILSIFCFGKLSVSAKGEIFS